MRHTLYQDLINRWIEVPKVPQRIVSVVPSQTELLYDFGLEESVVGITKFCVHPLHWKKSKTLVGGTKKLNLLKIEQLKPDLIIANKEENTEADIRAIEKFCPVWVSDVKTLEENYTMIRLLGELLDCKKIAAQIIKTTKQKFPVEKKLKEHNKAAYLIWRKPWMSIGHDTFIHDILRQIGLNNVFSNEARYPSFTLEELQAKDPDLVLLSSEPFPFKQKHIDELQMGLPNAHIQLVDGEMFSWYGSRMIEAGPYLKQLIKSIRKEKKHLKLEARNTP